jgi:hypothetical protein
MPLDTALRYSLAHCRTVALVPVCPGSDKLTHLSTSRLAHLIGIDQKRVFEIERGAIPTLAEATAIRELIPEWTPIAVKNPNQSQITPKQGVER